MTLEKDTILLERYRIFDILGQGGMGSVYRGLDENLGVEVAVKENLYSSDEYNRQFRREATILASMRHPNLPRVSDHFEIEGQGQYLVMDYIEGEDLRQRMDRIGKLSDEEIIMIGAGVCDALTYLHSRNPPILHRDIKPGNIKISPDGGIFLVDFGLAKIVHGSQATTTGARAMTPGYSSPEQYGTARTDARSDIYSLGAMLYAAITATIPEDGLARAMDQADLTPIRKRVPGVSRRLVSVIEKALRVHPEDRYQNGEAFKMDLLSASGALKKRVEAGELTVPPPPPEVIAAIAEGKAPASDPVSTPVIDMSGESAARVRRQQQSRARKIILRIAFFTIVTFLGLFGILWRTGSLPEIWGTFNGQDSATENVIETPSIGETASIVDDATATATQDAAQIPTATSTIDPTDVPTNTPIPPPGAYVGGGAGQIAFASARIASDMPGISQIWMMNADGTGFFMITDQSDGACQPSWSPDGMQLVFVSPCVIDQTEFLDSYLYTINVDGTDVVQLGTELGSSDPDWSPDGTSILYTVSYDAVHTQIYRYDLENDTSVLMTVNDKVNLQASWSPVGNDFVFVSTWIGGQSLLVQRNDPESSPNQLSRSGEMLNNFPSWSPDGSQIAFSQRETDTSISTLILVSYEMLGLAATDYVEGRVTEVQFVPEGNPDFSPDGMWLAYESWPDGENHDIFIISLDSLEIIQLTTHPAYDFDPVWRPLTPTEN
ncbi:MAG: protein kinase [Chloroflexi bacterium]|nr:protein kinase [Chloroflexota bacterium]